MQAALWERLCAAGLGESQGCLANWIEGVPAGIHLAWPNEGEMLFLPSWAFMEELKEIMSSSSETPVRYMLDPFNLFTCKLMLPVSSQPFYIFFNPLPLDAAF